MTRDENPAKRYRLTGVRRLIATNLLASHREIPSVFIQEPCDLTAVSRHTLVATVMKATAGATQQFPMFNAHLVDGEVAQFARSDIGVAVDTDRGLMVPVVRDCAAKSVEAIHAELLELASRAHAGTLTPAEMRDATITVTSPGKRGGVLATPLINPPQTAIVGLHRIQQLPVVRDGAIVVRDIANLTVTFDHRVADGATAGDFTLTVARTLEQSAGGVAQ